jgi:hypothetical protein
MARLTPSVSLSAVAIIALAYSGTSIRAALEPQLRP